MALRLRRGTNADRLTVTPAEGELLYTTDTKKIYAGDGATVGGNIVSGINNLIEDLTPQLGGDLDLNSKTIVGNGSINITGTIDAGAITADVYGSVFGNDSEPLVDVINSKIILTNNSINDLNDVSSDGATIGQVLKWSGINWTPQDDTDTTLNLATVSLNDLGDVNVTGVQTSQVLTWGGSEWTASDIPSTVNNLTDLADVTITNPLDAHMLKYDNNTSSWVNFNFELQLNDIANVAAPSPGDEHIIKFKQSTGTWESELLTLSSLADVDTTALLLGDTLTWNGNTWTTSGGIGEIRETDIQGSVYGSDSNIILDSENFSIDINSITTNFLNTGSITTNFLNTGSFELNAANAPNLIIHRTDDSISFEGTSERIGFIQFQTTSILDTPNEIRSVFIKGYHDRLLISTGDGLVASNHMSFSEGKLHVGSTDIATEKLEVSGNGTFSGFLQVGRYADATARDAAVTAPAEGMIVFNQGTQKFQGYVSDTGLAGGGSANTTPGWVDLY